MVMGSTGWADFGHQIKKGTFYFAGVQDWTAEMPRTTRASRGGVVYHVQSRGNGRSDVFHKYDDFAAFVSLMLEAHGKVQMRLTGFSQMTSL